MHMYITLYFIRIPAEKKYQGILLNVTTTILATELPQQYFITLFFHYFTNTKTILFQLHAHTFWNSQRTPLNSSIMDICSTKWLFFATSCYYFNTTHEYHLILPVSFSQQYQKQPQNTLSFRVSQSLDTEKYDHSPTPPKNRFSPLKSWYTQTPAARNISTISGSHSGTSTKGNNQHPLTGKLHVFAREKNATTV